MQKITGIIIIIFINYLFFVGFFHESFLDNFGYGKMFIKKKFPCHQCNRSYELKTSLTRHIKFECGVERKFTCEVCGKKFKRKCHLNQHYVSHV